eukprot:GHVS01002137.1.p1 GENE.GHVS01002137.1~~GHVS01002137.1.p1  ORF type:complete len:604 (-),score=92.03 GHVS01002137.1:1155-2945(-)
MQPSNSECKEQTKLSSPIFPPPNVRVDPSLHQKVRRRAKTFAKRTVTSCTSSSPPRTPRFPSVSRHTSSSSGGSSTLCQNDQFLRTTCQNDQRKERPFCEGAAARRVLHAGGGAEQWINERCTTDRAQDDIEEDYRTNREVNVWELYGRPPSSSGSRLSDKTRKRFSNPAHSTITYSDKQDQRNRSVSHNVGTTWEGIGTTAKSPPGISRRRPHHPRSSRLVNCLPSLAQFPDSFGVHKSPTHSDGPQGKRQDQWHEESEEERSQKATAREDGELDDSDDDTASSIRGEVQALRHLRDEYPIYPLSPQSPPIMEMPPLLKALGVCHQTQKCTFDELSCSTALAVLQSHTVEKSEVEFATSGEGKIRTGRIENLCEIPNTVQKLGISSRYETGARRTTTLCATAMPISAMPSPKPPASVFSSRSSTQLRRPPRLLRSTAPAAAVYRTPPMKHEARETYSFDYALPSTPSSRPLSTTTSSSPPFSTTECTSGSNLEMRSPPRRNFDLGLSRSSAGGRVVLEEMAKLTHLVVGALEQSDRSTSTTTGGPDLEAKAIEEHAEEKKGIPSTKRCCLRIRWRWKTRMKDGIRKESVAAQPGH